MTIFDEQRRTYLRSFPGTKTFQTFPDNKNRPLSLIQQFHTTEDYPINIIRKLEKLNRVGSGVYLTINETDGTGRKIENITRVRAVFADFDGEPLPNTFEIEPSMIVESSKGRWHAYWFTRDFPKESFRAIQEAISKKYNTDPVVKDLSRVMRVPGFYHNKRIPFLTNIKSYSGSTYTYKEIVQAFPPKRRKWSAPRFQKPQTFEGEFRGTYGAVKGERNCHLARRIGGMIKRGLNWAVIQQEALREAQACIPPLSEREARAVLRSMRRYR